MSKARDLANFVSAGNPLADGTIDVADINGLTATVDELNYVDGVTSAVQTQLDGKLTAASNLSDVADASTARTNLGVAIGTDVQAYDSNLTSFVSAFTLPTSDGTSGQVLQTNGSGTLSLSTPAGGGMKSMQVFTSSGTWTKPAGINLIRVRVQGGGSGGCGYSTGAPSGAAGGYVEEVIDVSGVSTVSVTVGAGGAGASGTGSSGAGGTSSFGAYCTASGGGAGTPNLVGYLGPLGGTGSGGNLNVSGSDGFGTSGEHPSGGASYFGQGGRGKYGNASGNADSGQAYGSGGGAARWAAGNTPSGGAGAPGVVIVEEYE